MRLVTNGRLLQIFGELLKEGEDIVSGLEAEADNAGIDLQEVRRWWQRARQAIEEVEANRG